MIRNLIALTALATLTLAAPAFAETEVHVSLTGKSTAQAYADITAAAHTVCSAPVPGESSALYSVEACVRASVVAAVEQAKIPALSQYARNSGAYLHLASN